jgi:hypothetical protein
LFYLFYCAEGTGNCPWLANFNVCVYVLLVCKEFGGEISIPAIQKMAAGAAGVVGAGPYQYFLSSDINLPVAVNM